MKDLAPPSRLRLPTEGMRRIVPALLLVGVAFSGAPGVSAQTSTTGGLAGTVVTLDGAGLDAVLLTLRREGDGSEIPGETSRDGSFSFSFLDPGAYALFVERLGHVPVEVTGLAVGSGRIARVRIPLRAQAQPVMQVERLDAASVRSGGAGAGWPLLSSTLELLPVAGPGLAPVALFYPFEGNRFAARGLPGSETGLRIDGIPHGAGRLPVRGREPGWGEGLPSSIFAELVPASFPADVEGSGTAGALLRGSTRTGGAVRRLELQAGVSHQPSTATETARGIERGTAIPDLTLRVEGPIASDTLRYLLLIDARRTSEAAFRGRASEVAELDALLAARGMSNGDGFPVQGTANRDRISAFGRLDWRPGRGRSLILRGGGSLTRGEAWGPGFLQPVEGGPASNSVSSWVGASFLNAFGDASAVEIRLGLETATSTHDPVGPGTGPYRVIVHRGAAEMGADPESSGTYGRLAVTFAPVLHHMGARHQARGGLRISAERHEARDRLSPGQLLFLPVLDGPENRRGLLLDAAGRQADASFWSPRVSFFLENRWQATAGLGISAGVSVDRQALPTESLGRNERWEEASGVDYREIEQPRWGLEPRVAFDWAPEGLPLEMHGAVAIRRGGLDPALLLEVLGDTGAVRIDQALGSFGSWSGGPPGAQLFDVRGTRGTLLGPRFAPPRTRSLEAGIASALGGRTRVGVTLEHRETHFLPRVRDLNRVPGRFARDELGRDILGEVVQRDGVIGIRPGSDRRFGTFEVVRVVESDGWSRSLSVTLSARHDFPGGHQVDAAYTRSDTRDDTPLSPWGAPLIVRARGDAGAADPSWLEGASDLHRPDNLRVRGTFRVPGLPGASVGGVYVFESGIPFTPTVRDLLGGSDGSGRHADEPIHLPASVAGLVAPLEGAWPCLRDLRAGDRERNRCRTEAVHRLDLRITVELPSPGGSRWALQVDAHDLLEGARGTPDAALFLVDGSQPFTYDGGSGELRLPLLVNPGFGKSLHAPLPGRSFRVGALVRF